MSAKTLSAAQQADQSAVHGFCPGCRPHSPAPSLLDLLRIGTAGAVRKRAYVLVLPERIRCDRSDVRCASRKQIGERGAKSAQTGRSFAADRCLALATRRLTRPISEFRAADACWREARLGPLTPAAALRRIGLAAPRARNACAPPDSPGNPAAPPAPARTPVRAPADRNGPCSTAWRDRCGATRGTSRRLPARRCWRLRFAAHARARGSLGRRPSPPLARARRARRPHRR